MKLAMLFVLVAFVVVSCKPTAALVTPADPKAPASIVEISPAEASAATAKAYSQFIDVRTAEEYASGYAERAENIPLDTLAANFDRLKKEDPVYVICQTGSRSKKAAELLKDAGFKSIYNVSGGTVAWQAAGLPMSSKPPHNIPAKKP